METQNKLNNSPTEEQELKKSEEYVKSQETDEIIFSAEASLYRYLAAEQSWTGRGKGKMRVSLEPKTNKYRISLIREKVFKHGCNHFIKEITALEKYPISEHAWLWNAFGDDCGDGLSPTQTYLAKFNTKEDAENFHTAVNKGIAHLASGSKGTVKETVREEPNKETVKDKEETKEEAKEEVKKESKETVKNDKSNEVAKEESEEADKEVSEEAAKDESKKKTAAEPSKNEPKKVAEEAAKE
ncbi:hypothetical protein NEMIN01_1420 [Nematocida minor]|uniref:uncharacterized protein n=1 Tax=Nematocida minor TaxID=1912983 RepID=UPI00221FC9AA|nr:uncharacterized protein NEMIN01_1420 [Nematocida minor]KAI5191212.1 hypothetical protein NEMIN01_1420 [Nematocida minor]